jgi:hypothetical protein
MLTQPVFKSQEIPPRLWNPKIHYLLGHTREKTPLDDLKKTKNIEIERGRTRSHAVEKSLWKRIHTSRKRLRGE